jgi:glucose/arabinose dehydrogenase
MVARAALLLTFTLILGACDVADVPDEQAQGPSPKIPPPSEALIPTINIARATGWPQGEMPKATDGLVVTPFATGLDHPRWLIVLPNGDVLVAETNTPKQDGIGGIKGMIMAWALKRAGAGVPSPNRIVLLRDADGDGVAETRSIFLEGLNSPFGMALVGEKLYVADTDALLRFDYKDGVTEITAAGTKKPICRRVPSIIIGRRVSRQAQTDRAFMWAWGRTATQARTASTGKRTARRSSKSTPQRARPAASRPACEIPWAWPSSRKAARYGSW